MQLLKVLQQFKDSSNSDGSDQDSIGEVKLTSHLSGKLTIPKSGFLFDKMELTPEPKNRNKGNHRSVSHKLKITCNSDHLDYDKDGSDDSDNSPNKAPKAPAFPEIRSIATRIFGAPAQIEFNISILKELSILKPEKIISLTPLAPSEMAEIGEVKWNIFLKKDLREYEENLSKFYGELNKLDEKGVEANLSEIFLIITSDKVSFQRISKFFSEEKEAAGIKISRRKAKPYGVFIMYLASYELPKQIEELGSELELTVKLERYH